MSRFEALKTLHTTLIDAEKGYETAIRDAKAPAIIALFEKVSALHARAHADVHAMLAAKGEHPDEAASLLSLVHKTVISVRSAVGGLDNSSLPSFVDGEKRIVEIYDRAMAEEGETGSGFETLRRNRAALLTAIAEMNAQAASAEAL